MQRRLTVLSALCLLLAGAALAEDSYSIKRVYKAGEVDRYKLVIHIEGATQIEITLVTKETTKAVKEDGVVVLETTIESGQMKLGGQEAPYPGSGQAITTTLDTKNGKILKTEGSASGPGLSGIVRMTRNLGIPDRPVKIGEEIKIDTPVNEGKDRVTSTLKVAGLEPKGDEIPVETVKLVVTAEVPALGVPGGEKLHLDATAYVEPGTGKQLMLIGTATGKLPMIGDAKLRIKRTRITSAAK